MNWTTIRVYAGVFGFAIAALLLQRAVPNADDAVRTAKSEITTEVLAERLAPTTRGLAPETRGAEAGQVGNKFVHAPVQRSVEVAQAPVQTVRATEKDPYATFLRLWRYFRYGKSWSGDNLATMTATPAANQIVRTYAMTAADPIDPYSGEMTLHFPIVKVAGVGLDFSFALSYRSDFSYDGPIGSRWEHNWNARFYFDAGATRLDRYADNRKDTYSHSGSGVYAAPYGFASDLLVTKYNDGTNRVDRRLRNGTLEIYREQIASSNWYFLTEIQHRDSDNKITASFDGSKRVTAITDTRGKNFTLTYDGSTDRLSTFEDWSGGGNSRDRGWTFAYNNTTHDLTKITSPHSRDTNFGYTGTNLLASIKAPREGSGGAAYLSNTYTGTKVTSQTLGRGSFSLSYGTNVCTETDREGGRRIFLFDGTSHAVTKIRQEVSSNTFVDTDIAWDSEHPTKIVHPEGNGVHLLYDSRMLTASIRGNATGMASTPSESSARASSNYLVKSYEYRTETNWQMVTKVKDPIGSNWLLGRDSTGNVTTYTTPAHSGDPYVIAYDSKSRVDTIDDPEGRRVGFLYGSSGTLSQVKIDPSGTPLTTTLGRDVFENVTRVTDPEQRYTVYARNVMGFVTKVTTNLGAETDYLYDANDVVTETHEDVGISGLNAERVITYTRDIMDLVVTKAELSKTTVYAYDANDRLTLVTPPVTARKVKHEYDLRGLELTRTRAYNSSDSAIDVMAYDANRRLTTRKDGLLNATNLSYDGFDRLITSTDAESHYGVTGFDKNGNVLDMYAYNSGNTMLSHTGGLFDLNNRLTKKLRYTATSGSPPPSVDTTFGYDKSGKLTAKTDGCGCGTGNVTYAYDAGGRLTKTTDAATNEVAYARDKAGLVTKVTSSEKEVTTRTYVVEYKFDGDRHLTEVVDKGGGSSTKRIALYDLDLMGRATKVTDGNSNEVLYVYDNYGRISEVKRGVSGDYVVIGTTYDLHDNVLTETSASGSTVYVYDSADRMTQMKDESNTAVKTLTYDDADNVVSKTDGNTSVSVHLYDVRNLVTEVTHTLAANVVGPTKVKFWYDGLGRVVTAVNQRGTTEFDARVERTWSLLSKLESETMWVGPTGESGAGTNSRTTAYVYDGSGRVSLIKYPDVDGNGNRTTVQRVYDGLNRVATILRKDPGAGGFVTVAAWTFQGPHRMTSLEFGNAVKETMSYDEYGRATALYHDRLASTGTRRDMFFFKRWYDGGDRVTKERRNFWDNAGNALTGAKDFGDIYGYDHQNRLATVVRSVGYTSHSQSAIDTASASTVDFYAKCAYTLDGVGNRKTLQYDSSNGSVSTPFGRDINGVDSENQLTSKAFYLYDQGQSTWSTTATSSTTIAYDVNGNHISTNPTVKVDVHNRIYESGTWRYRYDPFGRRVEKRNTDTGGFWHRYYYEGPNCVAEYKIHLDSGQPAEFASGAMWVRIFGTYLVDQLLWIKLDPCGECGTYADGYLHLDFLGSAVTGTLAADNGSGGHDIFEGYRYDEYGQPYFYDVYNNLTSASQVGQSYLYTGREWDAEMDGNSGRYYYRARYYDQTSGRFLSRDPIRDDELANSYTYVANSPPNFADPTGTQARPRNSRSPTQLDPNTYCPDAGDEYCRAIVVCPGNVQPVMDKNCLLPYRQMCLAGIAGVNAGLASGWQNQWNTYDATVAQANAVAAQALADIERDWPRYLLPDTRRGTIANINNVLQQTLAMAAGSLDTALNNLVDDARRAALGIGNTYAMLAIFCCRCPPPPDSRPTGPGTESGPGTRRSGTESAPGSRDSGSGSDSRSGGGACSKANGLLRPLGIDVLSTEQGKVK